MGEKTVWVATQKTGSRGVYHSTKKCARIIHPDNAVEKEKSVLFDDIRPCQYCHDVDWGQDRREQNRDYLRALKEASPEEV